MYHLEFTSSYQSFINSLLHSQCLARSVMDSRSIRRSSCPQSWTMESGQSSVTEWGRVQDYIVKWRLKTKDLAISQLRITHAEVIRPPDRRSSHLLSTGHSVLPLHQCSDEHSWQAVISLSKKKYLRATQIVDEEKFLCVEICQVINVEGIIGLEYYHLAKP